MKMIYENKFKQSFAFNEYKLEGTVDEGEFKGADQRTKVNRL